MAGLKRTDNKGRILKDGESQRKDGSYRYRYTDADGVRRDVYSKRLVPTDRLPPGCKDDLSLREKERKINRDLEDGIKAAVENKATLNDLFELYMANKPELKDTTRSNYFYMYNKYVRNDIGKKKIASIKYSDVKAFYNKLIKEKGFKPNSMEIIHTIIHPIFTLAVRDNYIRINPATGAMAEGAEAQARQSLENVKHILEEAGLSMANIVKTTVFLADMSLFADMNKVYATYFEGDFPARSAVAVKALPKDALVEIECIAVR